MRWLLFIGTIILVCPLQGQIVVQPQYEAYEPVEIKCSAPENAQILWEIDALSGQKKYSLVQYDTVQAFWGEPGRYEVEATVIVVDFDTKQFNVNRYKARFEIVGNHPPTPPPGPDNPDPPGPGPSPSPDVPSDQFDNLARRIDAEADKIGLQYDKRLAVSNIYQAASQKMGEPGGFVTVSEARYWIDTQLGSQGLDSSWSSVRQLVSDDAKNRTNLSWEEVKLYYQAIATGYKGS